VTWVKGNHSIKTGGWYLEAKRIQLNTFQTYVFNDEQTRLPTALHRHFRIVTRVSLVGVSKQL
jgi:hypothetical protein